MKSTGITAAILLACSACTSATETASKQPDQPNPQILAGFWYYGDMEAPGGADLVIYPSKEFLRDMPEIAKHGGVIIVRNQKDSPKLLRLKKPDLDGPEDNSCRNYTGIGVFVLNKVSIEQKTDAGDDTPYNVVKGSLVSATDLRVMHSECTGAAAEQKLLTE